VFVPVVLEASGYVGDAWHGYSDPLLRACAASMTQISKFIKRTRCCHWLPILIAKLSRLINWDLS